MRTHLEPNGLHTIIVAAPLAASLSISLKKVSGLPLAACHSASESRENTREKNNKKNGNNYVRN